MDFFPPASISIALVFKNYSVFFALALSAVFRYEVCNSTLTFPKLPTFVIATLDKTCPTRVYFEVAEDCVSGRVEESGSSWKQFS